MNIAHEIIVRHSKVNHPEYIGRFQSRRAAKAAAAKILKAMDTGDPVCIDVDAGDGEKASVYLFDTRSIIFLSVVSYKK